MNRFVALALLMASCQMPNNTEFGVAAVDAAATSAPDALMAPPAPPDSGTDAASPTRPAVDAGRPDAPPDVGPPPPVPMRNGTSCATGAGCISGFCEDHWCCERACDVCEKCAATPGKCTPIVNYDDGDNTTCGDVENSTCLAAGRCGHVDRRNEGEAVYLDAGTGFAQAVVMGATGRLMAVRIHGRCTENSTIEIRDDAGRAPGDRTLARQAISGESLIPNVFWTLFVFESPAQVSAGQRVWLVLNYSSAGICSLAVTVSNLTAGGASQFVSGAWVPDTIDTLIFQTFVEP